MIKRLAHLCFFSDQAETMLTFYQEVLGFPIKFAMKHDDGTPFGWYLDVGDTTFIEIFDQKGAVKQWGGEVHALQHPAGSRYKHFCLEVDDLEAMRNDLISKGVKVNAISQGLDHSLQFWAKDPDGNDIEFMQYTPRSLQIQ